MRSLPARMRSQSRSSCSCTDSDLVSSTETKAQFFVSLLHLLLLVVSLVSILCFPLHMLPFVDAYNLAWYLLLFTTWIIQPFVDAYNLE